MVTWTPHTTPDRVHALLHKFEWTQERLARELNVSFATVNRWCRGHTIPMPSLQDRLEALERRKTP